MFCAFHEGRLAHEQCEICGKPVCPDCQRQINGRSFCLNCFPSAGADVQADQLSPVTAAFLAIFPGLGQVYNGQLLKGCFIFFTSWLVIPWLYGIYDAYATACKINNKDLGINPAPALLSGCLLSVILLLGFFSGGPFFMLRMFPSAVEWLIGNGGQGQAVRILQEIADAVSAFRADHRRFPDDERELYFGDIAYLKTMYCGTERGGYRFSCVFSPEGYEITAKPLKDGRLGYRMISGVMETLE